MQDLIIDEIYKEKLNMWKQMYWKGWQEKGKKEKILALRLLAKHLNTHVKVLEAGFYAYRNQTIYINAERQSVISTLHEVAHSLFGESEKLATNWSRKLFSEIFRKDYNKLKQKQGMMVK